MTRLNHRTRHKNRLQSPLPIPLPHQQASSPKKNLCPKTERRALRGNRVKFFCAGDFWQGTGVEGQHPHASRRNEHDKPRGYPSYVPQHRLGAKIIAETLCQAGTPCVETVAVMTKYNPFFEEAGMQRIAESKPSVHVSRALKELEGWALTMH